MGAQSIREIELTKIGDSGGTAYIGVTHEGKFKTMRMDRVLQVVEQITTGHPSSLHAAPTYQSELPKFPLENAVYKVPTNRGRHTHLDGRSQRLQLHVS